ncbi:MAG: NAD(P)H-dependent glycerol-3-phosphate dehydrogenase [Vampirovibrionia bacterium]
MKISILGCGTFGTAFNNYFTKKGDKVYLECIEDSEVILVAVPSYAVMEVLSGLKNEIINQTIVICAKGFNPDGRLLSEALKEEFPNCEILFLYGPTLADEFEKGNFTGMVLAGEGDHKINFKKKIESDSLYIETSDDVVGVQVGAALKNVVAIFLGITEGALLGQNTKAFVFSKGVEEIREFGVILGADPNTFLGLTCVGDLVLSSRNRELGIELGRGKKITEFSPKIGSPQEGIATLKIARIIAKERGIEIPFINTLYSVIFEDLEIKKAIHML